MLGPGGRPTDPLGPGASEAPGEQAEDLADDMAAELAEGLVSIGAAGGTVLSSVLDTARGYAEDAKAFNTRRAYRIQGSHQDLAQVYIDESGGRVMGVDLGTCNCSACVYVDGKPVIINLADDDAPTGSARTLASVGYDEGGRATIGAKAAQALPRNPKRTIFGAKRFIGCQEHTTRACTPTTAGTTAAACPSMVAVTTFGAACGSAR